MKFKSLPLLSIIYIKKKKLIKFKSEQYNTFLFWLFGFNFKKLNPKFGSNIFIYVFYILMHYTYIY